MIELQSCFDLTGLPSPPHTPPHPLQKTQMLCNLEELSGLLCLCSDYYYYFAVVWNI